MSVNKKDKKKIYTRPCAKTNCRGYIDRDDTKCGLCCTQFCAACFEEEKSGHVCKEEDIATAKAIIKDSKPCPHCHSLTFKVSGCSQMWCTVCKQSWDWHRGVLEPNEPIHNPHFFEYLKTQQGSAAHHRLQLGDCERIGTHAMTAYAMKMGEGWHWLMDIARLDLHLRAFEIPKYTINHYRDNEELRVKFLSNEIDESAFKKRLSQREKSNAKKTEIRLILEMFLRASMDLGKRGVKATSLESSSQVREEYMALCDFTNIALATVAKQFKSNKTVSINTQTMAFCDRLTSDSNRDEEKKSNS
jgi:hypothetical protein